MRLRCASILKLHACGHTSSQRVKTGATTSAINHHHGRSASLSDNNDDDGQDLKTSQKIYQTRYFMLKDVFSLLAKSAFSTGMFDVLGVLELYAAGGVLAITPYSRRARYLMSNVGVLDYSISPSTAATSVSLV